MLLGRVFALTALARSGLLDTPPNSSSGGSHDEQLAAVAAVADQLVGLLHRKAFLREVAAAGLVELLQGRSTQDMAAVFDQSKALTAILTMPAASAIPESLLLALRLWHNLPAAILERCEVLPKSNPGQSQSQPKGHQSGSPTLTPPPALFWQQPQEVPRSAVAGAAAAMFTQQHMVLLQPVLLATTASAPRLHQVWGCLLALLLPGFTPTRVSAGVGRGVTE